MELWLKFNFSPQCLSKHGRENKLQLKVNWVQTYNLCSDFVVRELGCNNLTKLCNSFEVFSQNNVVFYYKLNLTVVFNSIINEPLQIVCLRMFTPFTKKKKIYSKIYWNKN